MFDEIRLADSLGEILVEWTEEDYDSHLDNSASSQKFVARIDRETKKRSWRCNFMVGKHPIPIGDRAMLNDLLNRLLNLSNDYQLKKMDFGKRIRLWNISIFGIII